jgi:predicted transcriptional regulator
MPSTTTTRSRPAPRPVVQILARVDPGLKARITVLAAQRGCFESTVIREALEAFVSAAERKRGRS